MHFYRIAGLTVSSEASLPGARKTAEQGPADIVMRLGPTPRALDHVTSSMPGWDWNEEHILFQAQGVGRFLLTQGREVQFEPEDATAAADCAIYLQGSVFGMLLHQRGLIVLHASAVEVNGKAVLICGRSGLGKSTLAAALCQRGHRLLSDDVSAIAFDEAGQAWVSGDARQHKLTAGAIDALALDGQRHGPVSRSADKYYVEPLAASSGSNTPVAAVLALRREQPGWPVGLVDIDRINAVRVLLRNAYRPHIVKHTGQTRRYLEAAGAITARCSVSRLTRADDLGRLKEMAALVESHWASIGLSGDASRPGRP